MISALKINKWAGFTLAVIALSAQAAPAPQHIDVKQYKKVEDVVVPLPNEVFAALNKLGPVNWKEFVRTEKGANFSERPRTALLLGNVIADGFIAVQAQDAPAVKEIGQRVLSLAKGIGVGASITPHAKAITEAADKRKWDSVRQELDRTQKQRPGGDERTAGSKALAVGQPWRLAARHPDPHRGGEQAFHSGRRRAFASTGPAQVFRGSIKLHAGIQRARG